MRFAELVGITDAEFYIPPKVWGTRPECKNCIFFNNKETLNCGSLENPYIAPIIPDEEEGRCIYFKEKPVKPSVVEVVIAKTSRIFSLLNPSV